MTARIAVAWALVGIPLAYGLVETHPQGGDAVHGLGSSATRRGSVPCGG